MTGNSVELRICERAGGKYVWASTTEFPDGWPALSVPTVVQVRRDARASGCNATAAWCFLRGVRAMSFGVPLLHCGVEGKKKQNACGFFFFVLVYLLL